jgi:hypothetical protein
MNHGVDDGHADLESVRKAFLRVGLDLAEEELMRLVPWLQAAQRNIDLIADLELLDVEPQVAFDARWHE